MSKVSSMADARVNVAIPSSLHSKLKDMLPDVSKEKGLRVQLSMTQLVADMLLEAIERRESEKRTAGSKERRLKETG